MLPAPRFRGDTSQSDVGGTSPHPTHISSRSTGDLLSLGGDASGPPSSSSAAPSLMTRWMSFDPNSPQSPSGGVGTASLGHGANRRVSLGGAAAHHIQIQQVTPRASYLPGPSQQQQQQQQQSAPSDQLAGLTSAGTASYSSASSAMTSDRKAHV